VTTVLSLLLAGLVCAPASAALLSVGRWQVRRPRMALALWIGVGALGLVMAGGAVVLAIALSILEGSADGAVKALVLTLVAWIGLGGTGIVLSLGLLTGERRPRPEPSFVQASSAARAVSVVPASVAPWARRRVPWAADGVALLGVDDPGMIARAVPGRHAEIVVSEQARRGLTPSQLDAIVAHEYAHLTGYHGALREIGAWQASCLPKNSGLRRRLCTRLDLVTELAADDGAARVVGADRLRSALHAADVLHPSAELRVRAARLAARPDARRGDEEAHLARSAGPGRREND
jgi:Zn-dependent protease with chaperone function